MAPDPPLRIGIIGCGNVTMCCHIPALRSLEGVRVVAVADLASPRAQEALAALELPRERGHRSHREMLQASELDYVLVAVPPSVRPAIIEDCFEAGLHVLSEKPLAVSPAAGRALCDRAERAGLKFGMVHNYLFFPEYRSIREQIESGAIGELRHLGLSFMGVPDLPGHPGYRPLWRHDPAEAGGGILMDMIHVLYVAEYLAGGPIRAVSAAIDNLGYPGEPIEDLALIQLYFDRAYASVHLGWGHGPGGIQITGAEGRILAFYQDYQTGPFAEMERLVVISPQGRNELPLKKGSAIPETFQELHHDFIHAIQSDRQPVAPAQEGLRILEAALAAYASAVRGRVVELPLDPDQPAYRKGIEGLGALDAWAGSPAARRGLLGLDRTEGERT